MSDRYEEFSSLRFERPADHVLRIVLDGPGRREGSFFGPPTHPFIHPPFAKDLKFP